MTNTYKTITLPSEGTFKEKGSKFLAFAFPVYSLAEIKETVKNFKKEYFDARHVCYAYKLGYEGEEYRANDDGEPSGTAGRPILGQINAHELTNILVIVVRYFGGVLLGTGGLVVAYKQATIAALNNAEIIEKAIDEQIIINFEYILMNDIMRLIKESNSQITKQNFDNQCSIELTVSKQEATTLVAKLDKIIGIVIQK